MMLCVAHAFIPSVSMCCVCACVCEYVRVHVYVCITSFGDDETRNSCRKGNLNPKLLLSVTFQTFRLKRDSDLLHLRF